jgi:hypothetical protein
VQTEDASIAKTIENLYNLGTLGADDVGAADFSDVLMPAGATPAPFTPITSLETPAVPAAGHSRKLFRVVPQNFARAIPGQKTFDSEKDYYGRQSADY